MAFSTKNRMLADPYVLQCRFCGWADHNRDYCGRCGRWKSIEYTDAYGHPVPPGITLASGEVCAEWATNSKKDGDAMFAVISYKFAEGAAPSIASRATQADAQEYAETLIASFRANIQVKQFFSVCILNIKTGQFIGSVVDAPPAITWTAASQSSS